MSSTSLPSAASPSSTRLPSEEFPSFAPSTQYVLVCVNKAPFGTELRGRLTDQHIRQALYVQNGDSAPRVYSTESEAHNAMMREISQKKSGGPNIPLLMVSSASITYGVVDIVITNPPPRR